MSANLTIGILDGLLGAVATGYVLKGVTTMGYNPMIFGFLVVGGAGLIMTMISNRVVSMFPTASLNVLTYVVEPALLGIIVVALVTILGFIGGKGVPSNKVLMMLFAAGYVIHIVGKYIMQLYYSKYKM